MGERLTGIGQDREWRAAILLVAGLTVARLVALFTTPLELYPDEAQYWLWSRTLDFGYYSKPPMIAWTIWATTAFGGDAEAWVRLGAPLFQAGAALLVFAIGRRLYDARVALAATALYALAPAIQLSAAVIATDAPLLFFLGLTILLYATLQTAEGRRGHLAAGVGASLGLAFLSKYAAVYGLIGIALHLVLSEDARRAWSPNRILLALGAFAAVLAPNVIWNAQHGFATVQHTAANAAWGGRQLFNFPELGEFLLTQFGVFGPIPFAALIVGLVVAIRRRTLAAEDLLLLCFVLPPLLIVIGQSFVSRANANWSGAAYLPGAVLVAAWLVHWRARRWLMAAIVLQATIAALFLAFTISPAFAERMGGGEQLQAGQGMVADHRGDPDARGGRGAGGPHRHRGQQPLPLLRHALLWPRLVRRPERPAAQGLAARRHPPEPGRDQRPANAR
ncbi:glycosyltransferase family 39 protein [Phenylobacterium sp. J367]|uniref:glycosyltransferase family 39 protein n=1 Tax=Phenylobacterium sp. J367 TaxID=2898435 RepID=UPI002150E5DE|nr:glycosyltransferase family 39 protein [Phenylobacterium sp. J367]MCR5877767.1 glycosyltransferase family 39 protein [Phenylobacterium sp. J367]